MNGTAMPQDGSRPNTIATSIGTQPYTPARVAMNSDSAVTSSSVSTGAARIASYVRWNWYLTNVPDAGGERARRAPPSPPSQSHDELDVVVAADRPHQRSEAEAESEQVDRRLDGRRERRRAPVRRSSTTSRTRTPVRAERSSLAHRWAGPGRDRHQPISSPVSSTNTSSRSPWPPLALAGEPVLAVDAEDRDARARPPPRAQPGRARLGFHLAGRRRAVHLEHLDPHAPRRGPPAARGDRLAVRHDQHRVGESLCLLDVVRRHEDRRALAQGVDERPELLPHLRVEADRRLVEQHERAVDERARDQQPPPHAARACRRACRAGRRASPSAARVPRSRRCARAGRSGTGARTRAGSARQLRVVSRLSSCGVTPSSARACFDSSGA